VTGVASVQCTCERAIPGPCLGLELPQGILSKKVRACGLIARAMARADRGRTLLRSAGRKLAAAARQSLKAAHQGRITAACADALAAQLRDGKTRAVTFAKSL